MQVIATLHDLDPTLYPPFPENPETRTAARAVLFDDEGHVALLHVGTEGIHKIPGGGVEEGEDIAKALQRELLEEAGCHA